MEKLKHKEFFAFVLSVVRPESYCEAFGGYGGRTITPVYGKVDEIVAAEIDSERRSALRREFPNVRVFGDYNELIKKNMKFDLVSFDCPFAFEETLGSIEVIPAMRMLAKKAVIGYVPVDIRSYVNRCSHDRRECRIAYLEHQSEDFFNGEASPQKVADIIGGKVIALRAGKHDLQYFAIEL